MATEQQQSVTVEASDRELVARFVAHQDEPAFREIVRRHGPMVLGVCRRVLGEVHEAEDVFQATFLVLARSAHKIRRRNSIACWLHGVAYRISLRVSRRKYRHMEPLSEDQAGSDPSTLQRIAQRDDQRLVDEELSKLPGKERESLTLRYLQGCSNSEIAETLEISVSAVEGRLKRAKDRLRRRLLRRGVTWGAFLGAVLAQSNRASSASETLVELTIHQGLLEVAGELTGSSAAHELALSEIGEMAMSIKQVGTIAAVTLLTVGLGLYGLSGSVVGQERENAVDVVGAVPEPEDLAVKLMPTRKTAAGSDRLNSIDQLGSEAARARLEKAARISANLDQEILIEFVDAPLTEIVDYVSTARSIPIVIDTRALEDVGFAPDMAISCNFKAISLRSALALMLEPLGLTYVVRDEVLKITSKDEAETQLDPRFYRMETDNPDELIELITSMVAPTSWDEVGGPGSIRAMNRSHLVISQTDRVHDQVAEFLEKLHEATGQ
jgi:RNA polymerase sigma factor (sigma-70 family)